MERTIIGTIIILVLLTLYLSSFNDRRAYDPPIQGTYTPTLTAISNVAATTAYLCQYYRIGNAVTVSGKFDIDPTASGSTSMGISLPIASNFGNDFESGGVSAAGAVADLVGSIKADGTNDRAQLDFTIPVSASLANNSWFFTFTYSIH